MSIYSHTQCFLYRTPGHAAACQFSPDEKKTCCADDKGTYGRCTGKVCTVIPAVCSNESCGAEFYICDSHNISCDTLVGQAPLCLNCVKRYTAGDPNVTRKEVCLEHPRLSDTCRYRVLCCQTACRTELCESNVSHCGQCNRPYYICMDHRTENSFGAELCCKCRSS